jgi:hypothetical protein
VEARAQKQTERALAISVKIHILHAPLEYATEEKAAAADLCFSTSETSSIVGEGSGYEVIVEAVNPRQLSTIRVLERYVRPLYRNPPSALVTDKVAPR